LHNHALAVGITRRSFADRDLGSSKSFALSEALITQETIRKAQGRKPHRHSVTVSPIKTTAKDCRPPQKSPRISRKANALRRRRSSYSGKGSSGKNVFARTAYNNTRQRQGRRVRFHREILQHDPHALDQRLPQPGWVREEGRVSLTACPRNRQQASAMIHGLAVVLTQVIRFER
jgi:hypothetical protein